MSEVKWIKITTNIFNDEKIQLIEDMPDSDTIIVIWFKLLSLAGKSNSNGLVMISERVPYTKQMLTTIFRRKATVIELALHTFEQFGMIELLDNDTILIANWDKHQNVKGLDTIREQNKLRQQKHRDKLKLKEIELDKDIDIESNVTNNVIIPYQLIITYLNKKVGTAYKSSSKESQRLIKLRFKSGFTLEDFYKVIDNKYDDWFKTDMEQYLRPMTLFGTKFESYLNQVSNKKKDIDEPDWLNGYIEKL